MGVRVAWERFEVDRDEVNLKTKKVSISLGRKEIPQQMHKHAIANYANSRMFFLYIKYFYQRL